MEFSGSMLKSVVVAMVLVVVVQSGPAEKLASCCKQVTNQEIEEPILGYLVQRPNPPCVRAVIFQTKTGLFCSQVTAPWVRRKIVAFEEAKARAAAMSLVSTPSPSLLSIIKSSASPPPSSTSFPSSSSPLPSFPSTSGMTTDETSSEADYE